MAVNISDGNQGWKSIENVKRYINGSWESLNFIRVYENGVWIDKWVSFDGVIYNLGDEKIKFTGGWLGFNKYSSYLEHYITAGPNSGTYNSIMGYESLPIDLTKYTKIKIQASWNGVCYYASSVYANLRIGDSPAGNQNKDVQILYKNSYDYVYNGSGLLEVDIANIVGLKYISIRSNAANGSTGNVTNLRFKISKIWLE